MAPCSSMATVRAHPPWEVLEEAQLAAGLAAPALARWVEHLAQSITVRRASLPPRTSIFPRCKSRPRSSQAEASLLTQAKRRRSSRFSSSSKRKRNSPCLRQERLWHTRMSLILSLVLRKLMNKRPAKDFLRQLLHRSRCLT